MLRGRDPDLAYDSIVLVVRSDVPEEIPLDVGQACAGAIGALDHLAWHAYVHSGGDVTKKGGVFFPKEEAALTRDKWLRSIPSEVVTFFERVISEGGDDLSAARELGNVDKHQDLHIVGFVERETSITTAEVPPGMEFLFEMPSAPTPLTPTRGTPVAGALWAYEGTGQTVPRSDAPPLPDFDVTLRYGVSIAQVRLSLTAVGAVIRRTAEAADEYEAIRRGLGLPV